MCRVPQRSWKSQPEQYLGNDGRAGVGLGGQHLLSHRDFSRSIASTGCWRRCFIFVCIGCSDPVRFARCAACFGPIEVQGGFGDTAQSINSQGIPDGRQRLCSERVIDAGFDFFPRGEADNFDHIKPTQGCFFRPAKTGGRRIGTDCSYGASRSSSKPRDPTSRCQFFASWSARLFDQFDVFANCWSAGNRAGACVARDDRPGWNDLHSRSICACQRRFGIEAVGPGFGKRFRDSITTAQAVWNRVCLFQWFKIME